MDDGHQHIGVMYTNLQNVIDDIDDLIITFGRGPHETN